MSQVELVDTAHPQVRRVTVAGRSAGHVFVAGGGFVAVPRSGRRSWHVSKRDAIEAVAAAARPGLARVGQETS